MGRIMLKSALLTMVTLFGGMLIGFATGELVFRLIPGSSVDDVRVGHAVIAAIPALLGFLVGGAIWGVQMGRLAGTPALRRMALAGMVGFGPLTIVLALGLAMAEPAIIAMAQLPLHRVFTLLFAPSAFLIAATSAFAIGKGLRDDKLAIALFWRVGLAAGITFLVVNLAMEAAGWVVGAPGAAERATMITVLALGNLAAALVGGGLTGRLLQQKSTQIRSRPVSQQPA